MRQLFSVPVASYSYPPKDNPQALNYVSRMKEIHRNNHQSYGRRHIKVVLENQGIFLGVFKIMRLMKSAGIIAKAPKKPHYYPSGNQLPTIPNILKRQFKQDKINTHWVGDITYIRNHQRWSYLATVLDLGSRESRLRPVADTRCTAFSPGLGQCNKNATACHSTTSVSFRSRYLIHSRTA